MAWSYLAPRRFDGGDWFAGGGLGFSAQGTQAVQEVMGLQLVGGWALTDRLRLVADAPMGLARTEPTGGPFLGDPSLTAHWQLRRPLQGEVGAGLNLGVDLPGGAHARGLGQPGPGARLGLAVGGTTERLFWSGQVAGETGPWGLDVAAGLGALVGDVAGAGLELRSHTLAGPVPPVEALAVGRVVLPTGLRFTGAAGTRLTAADGAPSARLELTVAMGTAPPPRDGDGDGVADVSDVCPLQAETDNGYRDGDGCPDLLPRYSLVAIRDDIAVRGAQWRVTLADGTVGEGAGAFQLTGMPGDTVSVEVWVGACFQTVADVVLPDQMGPLPIALERSPAAVDDPACAPPTLAVTPAEARVWVPHPTCKWLPISEAADVIASLPPGTAVQVSAPGHLPAEVSLVGATAAALERAPAQGGVVLVSDPRSQIHLDGEPLVPGEDGVVVLSAAEGGHQVEVVGGGQVWTSELPVGDGFTLWVRAPAPEPFAVLFGSGSSTVDAGAGGDLDELAEGAADWHVTLVGSYSPEGSLESNIALATQRSQAVAALLIEAGVPAGHVRVAEPEPPQEGLSAAEQRRVDLRWVGGAR